MTQTSQAVQSKLLLLRVPRTNDKKELAAEQMFVRINATFYLGKTRIF